MNVHVDSIDSTVVPLLEKEKSWLSKQKQTEHATGSYLQEQETDNHHQQITEHSYRSNNQKEHFSDELNFRVGKALKYVQKDGVRCWYPVKMKMQLDVLSIEKQNQLTCNWPPGVTLGSPLVAVSAVTGGGTAQLQLPLCANGGSQQVVQVKDNHTVQKIGNGQLRWLCDAVDVMTVDNGVFCVQTVHQYPTKSVQVLSACATDVVLPISDQKVHLQFPPGALQSTVTVTASSQLADGAAAEDTCEKQTLASPVIILQPHGQKFESPVSIDLPVPDLRGICEQYHLQPPFEQHLQILHCDDPCHPQWTELPSNLKVDIASGTVNFHVRAFCGIKVVWKLAQLMLQKLHLGPLRLYPQLSFQMTCVALVHSHQDSEEFSLTVLVLRPGSRIPDRYIGAERVGGLELPTAVRSGTLIIRVQSTRFEACCGTELRQVEFNFKGVEFEKQFACRYVTGTQTCGYLGSVFVEKLVGGVVAKESLFGFNLHRTSTDQHANSSANTMTSAQFAEAQPITVESLLMFAQIITVDPHSLWMQLALQLGFNMLEINHLRTCTNPLQTVVNLYRDKGGNFLELCRALYLVKDQPFTQVESEFSFINVIGSTPIKTPRKTPHKTPHKTPLKGDGTPRKRPLKHFLSCPTHVENNNNNVESDWYAGADADDDADDDSFPEGYSAASMCSKKTARADLSMKLKKRRRSWSLPSDSTEDEVEMLRTPVPKKRKVQLPVVGDSPTKEESGSLDETQLWAVSEGLGMRSADWRNVGRDLGLTETELVDLEHRYGKISLRELAYQMLLVWQMGHPEQCVRGVLHKVLCSNGLRATSRLLTAN